ncbi:MAG: hypothetical protein ACE5E5_16510 [Phycisphaerae bacterium]
MSLMTPRGLKIRLELPWAFTLLGRLWKVDCRTDAFRVLKTCEGIESMPSFLSWLLGLAVAFYPGRPEWAIIVAIAGARIAGQLLMDLGRFDVLRPLGLLWLGTVWSYIAGWGLIHIPAIITLLLVFGWKDAGCWIAGHVAAVVLAAAIGFYFTKRYFRSTGFPFTSSETNFFSAYRLHADRLGLTRDIEVNDDEMETGLWEECLEDYARKYPEAVARFPR